MCGRFSLIASMDEIQRGIGQELLCTGELPAPRYNISPGSKVFCTVQADGGYRGGWMEWGIQPEWAERRLINAKREKHASGKGYWRYWKPCLLPASGVYEWGRDKTVYNIRRTDNELLLLAALWGRSGDGEPRLVVLTDAAAGWMAPIHHRMPVVLSQSAADDWCRNGEVREMLGGGLFAATKVGSYVNKVGNEGPLCWDGAFGD